MVVYPGKLEPILDNRFDPPLPSFNVRFRDIPEVEHIGDSEADAIELAPGALLAALIIRKLTGQPMPVSSPIETGEIGFPSPICWLF